MGRGLRGSLWRPERLRGRAISISGLARVKTRRKMLHLGPLQGENRYPSPWSFRGLGFFIDILRFIGCNEFRLLEGRRGRGRPPGRAARTGVRLAVRGLPLHQDQQARPNRERALAVRAGSLGAADRRGRAPKRPAQQRREEDYEHASPKFKDVLSADRAKRVDSSTLAVRGAGFAGERPTRLR